jgi:hypothetical protein
MPNIIKRNPVVFLALVASGIMVFSGLIHPLTIDLQGALNGATKAVVGIILYYSLAKDGGLALIVSLAEAVLALALALKLRMSPDNQAALMSFIGIAASFFVHSNVTAPITADGTPVAKVTT